MPRMIYLDTESTQNKKGILIEIRQSNRFWDIVHKTQCISGALKRTP